MARKMLQCTEESVSKDHQQHLLSHTVLCLAHMAWPPVQILPTELSVMAVPRFEEIWKLCISIAVLLCCSYSSKQKHDHSHGLLIRIPVSLAVGGSFPISVRRQERVR